MLDKVKLNIKPLERDQVQAYYSSEFQIHHILEYILEQTGPANIVLTTFSVAEEYIRKLVQFKEEGLIVDLVIIADLRTAVKALQLSLFTNNVADDFLLGNNHAKVLLICTENWKVSVITSQNQTRGNRIECGMICTIPAIYDGLLSSIIEERKKMIDANAVFNGTIGED